MFKCFGLNLLDGGIDVRDGWKVELLVVRSDKRDMMGNQLDPDSKLPRLLVLIL